MRKDYILPIAVVAFLLISQKASGKSFAGDMSKPRGIRNNNPGNIKISSSAWRGKVPLHLNTDGVFEQFEGWVWGVRAMWKLISNYIEQGNNTIRKVISKYAPASENATGQYIAYVSNYSRVGADENLSGRDLYPVIDAMARLENGTQLGEIISRADYEKARTL